MNKETTRVRETYIDRILTDYLAWMAKDLRVIEPSEALRADLRRVIDEHMVKP